VAGAPGPTTRPLVVLGAVIVALSVGAVTATLLKRWLIAQPSAVASIGLTAIGLGVAVGCLQ
jgi:hypothetical protein